MGVRGLSSYIRANPSNFRTIKLRSSFIVLDGYNILNTLYVDSPIFTQYNGEFLEFDIVVEQFILNLRKCDLEPLIVFDGMHEPYKLSTVLRRHHDRLNTLSNLQQSATSRPLRDGTSEDFRISLQPYISYASFFRTLDRLNVRHVTADLEADQLVAALAIYLDAPLVSNDSDFFILAPYWTEDCGLIYVPTDLCDFKTVHLSDDGFYIEAQQFVGREGPAFRMLAPIQIPLFAVLCGNDYVPPGYFNSHLPGSAPQQPYVRPTAQAASVSAVASRNAVRFRRLADWLSGFGNDIVEPVERIMSKFPVSERASASHYLYTGLAAYHVPMEELPPYLSFLFGKIPPPTRFLQIPSIHYPVSATYGQKALKILAEGVQSPNNFATWPPRLMQAFRQARILTTPYDALYSYGIVCNSVVENYQCRDSFHLCTLPLRQLLVGILLAIHPTDGQRLPGLSGPPHMPSYTEYRRVGCARIEARRVTFERLSLRGYAGFQFLQQHLSLPTRPPSTPAWLHGLACLLFLWARSDTHREPLSLVASPVALSVCACAIVTQMRLLQYPDGGTIKERSNLVRSFKSLRRQWRNVEPLNFRFLHAIAQLQSISMHLASLVCIIDAIVEKEKASNEIEMLPPQVLFPSGCLAHHIACRLATIPPADRLPVVLTHWLPRMLGQMDHRYVEQVRWMLSALMKFVDSLVETTPSTNLLGHGRQMSNPDLASPPRPNRTWRRGGQSMRVNKRHNLEDIVSRDMRNVGLEDY